MYHFFYK